MFMHSNKIRKEICSRSKPDNISDMTRMVNLLTISVFYYLRPETRRMNHKTYWQEH